MAWSDVALGLIRQFEGCRLTSYPDPASGGDPWTIGWGSTGPEIGPGLTWTQEQCDDDLTVRVTALGAQIDAALMVTPTDGQKGALCSFAYNLGMHALQESTLLRKFNAGDTAGAAAEFPKWDLGGGHVMQGLLNRRLAEQAAFNS